MVLASQSFEFLRDEAMVVKRPHPESVMQSLECMFTWTRLEQCYGWKVGIFEKQLGTTEVKVVGRANSTT
jgi:hypothetical protein